MSTARFPGFTADISLSRSRIIYSAQNVRHPTEDWIHPADYVDQGCLARCVKDCGSECAGTTGQAKSTCIGECAGENRECQATCHRPGDPPGGGSGTGTGTTPANGLVIYGNYCGPGHGDPKGDITPVDAVDAACRTHDLCYDASGYFNCGCDRGLIVTLPAAIAATPTIAGRAAGVAILSYFSHAPCTCSVSLCAPPFGFPCVSVPFPAGVGGAGPC
ncbi:MAG: hypothetical protein ABI047_07615 [Jatrophihabitantaceae bacterium]